VFWGQQLTNLFHLAIAMAVDLGIDRLPTNCPDFKNASAKAMRGPAPDTSTTTTTLEECRTLAGVFYLTSMLGSSFKKIDGLTYTKFLDDCLTRLIAAKEYDSDLRLVQMVRLQRLAEETHTTEIASAPVQMYIKAFEADLERLKQNDPCRGMPEHSFLKMQYLTSEVLIQEISLSAVQENGSEPIRNYMDGLYRCVESVKALLAEFYNWPTNTYLTLPFSVFGQFAHAFICLVRLASLENEGWDMARSLVIDFPAFIEEAAVRYDQSTKSSPDGMPANNDSFAKWAHRLRWMKGIFEAKFVKQPEASNAATEERADSVRSSLYTPQDTYGSSAVTPSVQQPTPPDEVFSAEFFNYLEDADFWNSFGAGYNIGFADMDMGNMDAGLGS
jgi:hypothetical protein